MTSIVARFALCLLLAACLAIGDRTASANSWGLDRSDIWWNPNESGWGVMMVQQQESIFIAMFLYGADTKPHWYTGLLSYNGSIYQGDIGESTGPNHTGAFNPNTVARRTVGTARLTPNGDNRFTLNYTVDGVAVTKAIERLTFARTGWAERTTAASSET
ncbi:MAG TPA: hypothetical protein VNG69_11220 [Casimicrobiaceae bacterium]|nr:hypothetical protein [Casimicrobiaceae bacterium]